MCSGNHYAGKAWNASTPLSYGKGASGLYEYWHCCNCHRYYFDKDDIIGGYDASKWVDAEVDSKASTSDYEDDRVEFGGSGLIHKTIKLDDASSITVDGTRDAAYDSSSKYDFASSSGSTKATLETLYQGDMLYVYVSVNDETKANRDLSVSDSSTAIDAYDSVELRIDALRSEKLADDSWNGKEGDAYHLGDEETKYASVGRFNVSAGYASDDQYGEGCEFDDSFSLSSACKGDGKTVIKSVYSDDTHYGVEFAINLGSIATPLNSFGEIGIAAKVVDNSAKNTLADTIYFESVNENMDYVRNYSTFRFSDYKANGEGFDLASGASLIKDIKDGSLEGRDDINKVTLNASGCYLSSTSYDNFTAILQFDNIATGSANPYWDPKIVENAFLFGGSFDSTGKYQGYALSASDGWFEILKVNGTSNVKYIGGYTNAAYPNGVAVRLTVQGGVVSLTNADGTELSGSYFEVTTKELADYSAGKLGLLRNDDTATKITVSGLSSDPSSTATDAASGVAFVNEIKAAMKASAGWNFVGNGLTMNTTGYRLGSSTYTDFSAVLEMSGVSPSTDYNSHNPFFSNKAEKAFLFGGSTNENGDYQGYALHFNNGWFQVLKLNGYASTFIDGWSMNSDGVKVRLSLSGTTLTLTYADGSSLGTSYTKTTAVTLDDYAGGKVGALRNDDYASSLTIYEFAH